MSHSRFLQVLAATAAVSGALAIAADPAAAKLYRYEWNRSESVLIEKPDSKQCPGTCYSIGGQPFGINDRIGEFQSVSTTYDSGTHDFFWSSSFSEHKGKLPNGAWLVINNGPMPKSDDSSAILYMDGVTGRLTAYKFNKSKKANSWKKGILLGSWDGVVDLATDGTNSTLSLNANMADINNHAFGDDWMGVQFDERVGLWFHPVKNLAATYDESGEITAFKKGGTSWLDSGGNGMETEVVPEPSTALGLMAIGALTAGIKRRRDR